MYSAFGRSVMNIFVASKLFVLVSTYTLIKTLGLLCKLAYLFVSAGAARVDRGGVGAARADRGGVAPSLSLSLSLSLTLSFFFFSFSLSQDFTLPSI